MCLKVETDRGIIVVEPRLLFNKVVVDNHVFKTSAYSVMEVIAANFSILNCYWDAWVILRLFGLHEDGIQ